MRNILLLLLLLPFTAFADYYPGSVTLINGSVKSGFIEPPSGKESKLKFRADQKGKIEKIKVEEVQSFVFTNDENIVENWTTIFLANNRMLKLTEFNIDSDKSFVRIVKQGRINLYAVPFYANSGGGMKNFYHEADCFYLQRENDNFAFNIGIKRSDLNFMSGYDTHFVIETNFKEICPILIVKLKETELKSSTLSKIVDLYEEHCK